MNEFEKAVLKELRAISEGIEALRSHFEGVEADKAQTQEDVQKMFEDMQRENAALLKPPRG